MKPVSLIFRGNFFTILLFLSLPFIICSCAAVGRTESPFAGGLGGYLTPGFQVGNSNFSAHGLAGYERVWVNGTGNPRQNFLLLGGQGRYSLSDKENGNGLWAGGEFAYLNVKYKSDFGSSTANGFEAAALAGYRLEIATIPVSLYVAPGFFRAKNSGGGGSFGGFHGRVGFDIHFMSLLTSKGR
jgi:hypothetical protein